MSTILSQIKKFLPRRAKPRGAALILLIFFFVAITLAVIQGATIRSVLDLRNARTSSHSNAAFYATEAGLEDAYYRTVTNKNVPDKVSIDLGAASTTVQKIVSGVDNQYFAFGQSPTGEVRKGHLALSDGRLNLPVFYAVIAGDGGLSIGDNATIKGKGSRLADVYSNGPVTGTINSQVYGNVTSAHGTVFAPEIKNICTYVDNIGNPMFQSFVYEGAQSVPLTSVSLMFWRTGNIGPTTVDIVAYPYPQPLDPWYASFGLKSLAPPVDYPLLRASALTEETVDQSAISDQNIPIDWSGSYKGPLDWSTVPLTNPVILEPGHAYGILVTPPPVGTAGEKLSWCGSNNYLRQFNNAVHDFEFPWYWAYYGQTPYWERNVTVDFQYNYDSTYSLNYKLGLGNPVPNTLVGTALSGVVVSGAAKGTSIANSVIKGDAYYQTISADSSVLGARHVATAIPPRIEYPLSEKGINQFLQNFLMNNYPSYGFCGGLTPCFTNTQVGTSSLSVPIMGNAYGPGYYYDSWNWPKQPLTLSNGTYYITGLIFVEGDLDVGPHARLQCAPSMGSNSCMIIVDGTINAHDQATFAGSGSPGSFLYAVSLSPYCNGIPGDLASPWNDIANCLPGNNSIHLTDNVTGAIFYAPNGGIDLSNNVYANSVIGYKVIAHDNVTIEYDPLESLIVVAPSVNHANSGWNPTRWSEY